MEQIRKFIDESSLESDERHALYNDIDTLVKSGLEFKDAAKKALLNIINDVDLTIDDINKQIRGDDYADSGRNNSGDSDNGNCCSNDGDDNTGDDTHTIYENERTHFKLSRVKNSYEKKVNFEAIDKTIKKSEDGLTESLKAIFKAENDYLIKQLQKPNYDIADLAVRSTLKGRLNKSLKSSMLGISNEGKESIFVIKEFNIKNYKAKVGSIVSVAERWIKSRALTVSGIMSNQLQDKTSIIISNAIRSGIALGEVINQLEELFEPYMGTNVIVDSKLTTPFRLETIVRTNMTTAYNQGRIVAMRDPDVQEFIHGVEYSAILDDRTTDVCEFLDGRVFKVNDPELDRLTPPNHHSCRSLLVPVMIDEPIKKEDFLNAKDIGKARELAGKGFA